MMKTISLLPLFMLIMFATPGLAKENNFTFNYKNLNALSSVICQTISPELKSQKEVILSKFSIDRNRIGPQKKDLRYDIVGTCNIKIENQKVTHFGQQLSYQINLRNTSTVVGKIGLHHFSLRFLNGKLKTLFLDKYLSSRRLKFDLSKSRWNPSNNALQFNAKKRISVQMNGGQIGLETDNSLQFSNGVKLYQHWNYHSMTCKSKQSLDLKSCEKLTTLI